MKLISTDQVSLTGQVFEELRNGIITGELAPGSLHSVIGLAAQLGVSRTPVREALLQLATSGMVKFERSRGVRILQMSLTDIEEIHGLRIMLEVPSAHRAAGQIDDFQLGRVFAALEAMRSACESGNERSFQDADAKFHQFILEAAGNERVTQVVGTTRAQMAARGLTTTQTRTLWDILAVHEGIYERLVERDQRGTAGAMYNHIYETARLLLAQAADDPEAASKFRPPVLGITDEDDSPASTTKPKRKTRSTVAAYKDNHPQVPTAPSQETA